MSNADLLLKTFNSELLEHTQKLFKKIHPSQFIYQLCQKLKLNPPIYEYYEELNNSFKCKATLNNLIAEGFSNNKKDAKSIILLFIKY